MKVKIFSLSWFLLMALFIHLFPPMAWGQMEANENIGALGERVSRIEGTVEEMSKRLDDISVRLDNLNDGQHMLSKDFNEKMDTKFGQMNTKIDTQFMWTMGIIIGMWVTIMLAIAGLFATLILSLRRKASV